MLELEQKVGNRIDHYSDKCESHRVCHHSLYTSDNFSSAFVAFNATTHLNDLS